jgi:hypothetical protein
MVPLLQYCYVVPAKEGADTFTCCPPLLGQWSLQCMRVTALRYAFIPKRTNALTVLRIHCTYEFICVSASCKAHSFIRRRLQPHTHPLTLFHHSMQTPTHPSNRLTTHNNAFRKLPNPSVQSSIR